MDRDQVTSSNIRSIGYDTTTETLEVEFLSGWVYQYYGVPEGLYQQIMQTPSKGVFLNQYVKNAFAYSRVG